MLITAEMAILLTFLQHCGLHLWASFPSFDGAIKRSGLGNITPFVSCHYESVEGLQNIYPMAELFLWIFLNTRIPILSATKTFEIYIVTFRKFASFVD